MSDGLQIDVGPFRRLLELREKHTTAKTAADDAKELRDEAELAVYELLADSPIEGAFTIDLGEPYGRHSFLPRTTYYGRVLDKGTALHALRAQGLDDMIVEESIAAGRLHEEVRDRHEQARALPDGIDLTTTRGVTVTQKKSSKQASVADRAGGRVGL